MTVIVSKTGGTGVAGALADRGTERRGLQAAFVTLLAAIAVALLCAMPAHAYAGDTSWYRGHESASTYTISNANQLAGLADLVNAGTTFQGKTVKMGGLPNVGITLRLSGEWTPIGTAAHPFNGTFDGNGSTFSNLAITRGTQNIGLFGYAGSTSSIGNFTISGAIRLSQPSNSTAKIQNVGGAVGYTDGAVSKIKSSVTVTINTQVVATTQQSVVVANVGGIVGVVRGALSDCETTRTASVYILASSGPSDPDSSWIAQCAGGIAGVQGPDPAKLSTLKNPPSIQRCTNNAKVQLLTYAPGRNDRFGNPTFATSNFSGGIAGFSTGNVANCRNTGDINSAYPTTGNPTLGIGCRGNGGIVGGWRIDEEMVTPTDDSDPGLRYNYETKGDTAPITMTGCANTGVIFGSAMSGGIVGQAGSYTDIVGCYNTARVEGSRYTKPSPGGVVGRTYGDMSYCYNTGSVITTTGGGYYAAGVVGMLHSLGKDYAGNAIIPEVYGCYNTGYVETSTAQYRAGSLVGELDGGYMHDCWSLEGRSLNKSVSGLDNYIGTMVNCNEIPNARALSASAIATLNSNASNDSWSFYFALPAGAKYNQVISSNGNVAGPRIVTGTFTDTSATDLSKTSGTVTVSSNAAYSSSVDPVPAVTVKLANGTTLVQNADFKVVPQANSKGLPVGTACTGTVVGIGIYKGQLPQKVSYSIMKGPLSVCTISAETKYFNWAKQKPDVVIVRDASGNVVDPSEYTWDVDTASFNNSASTAYVNAQTRNSSTGYPITVTATDSGNYTGTITQNCFKISPVSFAGNSGAVASENPNQSTLKGGTVSWNGQTWNFADICDFEANGGMGNDDMRGKMKVKYTGQPITPTISGVSYMGRALKEIKEGDAWYNDPYSWGYLVLYGNPNPELGTSGQDANNLESVTNATHGTDYASFTLRSAPMSNFDNYVTVWFEIQPADITTDCTMTGTLHDTVAWDGYMAPQNDVGFTYNGMTLEQGKDFIIQYTKGEGDTMTATIQGVGNYTGQITKTYTVTGTQAGFSDTPATDWYVKDGSLEYVSTNGIMSGIGGTTQFQPYGTVSRGMVATVLYRIATAKTADTTDNDVSAPFSDVPSGSWYCAPIAWAQKNGIVTGYPGTGKFLPNNAVSRQELALMIARFVKYFGADTAVDADSIWSKDLEGVDKVASWAVDGMAWCVSQGIFNNYGNLNPTGMAQRCQMAKILRVTCTGVVFKTADGQLLTLGEMIDLMLAGQMAAPWDNAIDEPESAEALAEVEAPVTPGAQETASADVAPADAATSAPEASTDGDDSAQPAGFAL